MPKTEPLDLEAIATSWNPEEWARMADDDPSPVNQCGRAASLSVAALIAEVRRLQEAIRRAGHACEMEMEPWGPDDTEVDDGTIAAARILGVLKSALTPGGDHE